MNQKDTTLHKNDEILPQMKKLSTRDKMHPPNDKMHPVFKHVRGKWKELGNENEPIAKKDPEYSLQHLQNKTIGELEEISIRLNKILNNKIFLLKLKDKGEKLKSRSEAVSKALQLAREHQSELKMSAENEAYKDANVLEWPDGGNHDHGKEKLIQSQMRDEIEDESELDPLQLLATHSHEVPINKSIRHFDDDEDAASAIQRELEKLEINDSKLLATAEECSRLNGTIEGGSIVKNTTQGGSLVNGSVAVNSAFHNSHFAQANEEFSLKLLKMLGEKDKNKKKIQFKPFRTLKAPTPKEHKVKNPLLWMESSATGPIKPTHLQPTQFIPLQESLLLLKDAQKNEKVKMLVEAADHLRNEKTVKIGLPTSNYLNYRDANSQHHLLDDDYDDNENNDDDEGDDDENLLGGLAICTHSEDWDEG